MEGEERKADGHSSGWRSESERRMTARGKRERKKGRKMASATAGPQRQKGKK